MKNILLAAAAVALFASPVLAQTNTAPFASSHERTQGNQSHLGGDNQQSGGPREAQAQGFGAPYGSGVVRGAPSVVIVDPVETGSIVVARANAHVSYPSRIQLVAAMNPCKCGHLGDAALACSRAPRCAADYQARVSGPLLDRIDLHVEVQPVTAADLTLPPPSETSADVASRVASARSVQDARYASHVGVRTNAEADGKLLEAVATPDEPGRKLLAQAAEAMRLSARGYHRVLRVSRTLADLAGAETVGRVHVAEALSYRRRPPVN